MRGRFPPCSSVSPVVNAFKDAFRSGNLVIRNCLPKLRESEKIVRNEIIRL